MYSLMVLMIAILRAYLLGVNWDILMTKFLSMMKVSNWDILMVNSIKLVSTDG